MLINLFSIKNFRSIINAELPLSNYSILIGPNNQGKSNILRALTITLNTIEELSNPHFLKNRYLFARTRKTRLHYIHEYDYARDYPLNLQSKDDGQIGETRFSITFSLTNSEKKLLARLIPRTIKGDLTISLIFKHGLSQPTAIIRDSVNSKTILAKHHLDIFLFISERLQLDYIEAIRDSNKIVDVVETMIAAEFRILSSKKPYRDLMKKLVKLEKPMLKSLSQGLTSSVSGFLPDVKKIHLDSVERIRRIRSVSTSIQVDDGTKTDLELKGDGIKSLITISLLQHVSKRSSRKKKIILAVDEPESHLHPDAIHKLRKVLVEISAKDQVIISTHSPLLVDRSDISRNLIVNDTKAVAAKNISEIRQVLGVQIPDNLTTADLIVLVEGESDSIKLQRWLVELSTILKMAISDGVIVFDHLGGSANLSHKLLLWKALMCDVYTVLDNDKAANSSFNHYHGDALDLIKHSTFIRLDGYKESEMEDLILPAIYQDRLKNELDIDLENSKAFKTKKKWSVRMKAICKAQGKHWNNALKNHIKRIVHEESIKIGIKSIHHENQHILKKIQRDLEEHVKNKLNIKSTRKSR